MKKLLFILFLTININTTDYKKCTEDTKQIVDSIFKLIQSFEKDPLSPSKIDLKHILEETDKLSQECFNYDLNISNYENCIDDIYPVFFDIKRVLDDIQKGDNSKISLDFINIVLQLVNGVTTCIKDINSV